MTIHTKHDEGMFSWADVATTDPGAAKKFYAALFGWKTVDRPMSHGVYSICKLGDHDAAAITMLNDQQKQMKVPPHWTCYFTVKDVDARAAKVVAAGGKLIVPPSDVMDAGRMAAVDDPVQAGAVLWQPKKHAGAGVTSEPGAITWCELLTRDVDASGRFWTSVLGWRTESMKMLNGATYTVFKVGEARSCGMMAMPGSVPPNVPSHWLPYFQVESCDAAMKKVTELGGRVITPAMEAPGVGRFSTLMDPQGAAFAVLQPKR